jgi:hypothetical protein
MRLILRPLYAGILVLIALVALAGETHAQASAKKAESNRGQVLFVVGSNGMNDSDNAIKTRLEGLGLNVSVEQDNRLKDKTGKGESLILISSTISSAKVGGTFRNVAVPVMVCEPNLFDDMGMTHSEANVDYGSKENTELVILTPKHAMAAGKRGRFAISEQGISLGWGWPAKAALKIAAPNRDTDAAYIFAYESGAKMADMNAPARRIGMFLTDNVAVSLTEEGWALFDAAILWATGKAQSASK